MKNIKTFEGFSDWFKTKGKRKLSTKRSMSFMEGDTVMTPDGEGIVIPNEKGDDMIWVKLNDKSKSNYLTGDENVYQPEEVTRVK